MARARMRDERGASLVEYALMVALIAVVCIVAIAFLGESASGKFDVAGQTIKRTGDPVSTRNLSATCSFGSCQFQDPNYDPNFNYRWQFPDGSISTLDRPGWTHGDAGESFIVYGWKDDTRIAGRDDEEVMRVWCDRNNDGGYDCS